MPTSDADIALQPGRTHLRALRVSLQNRPGTLGTAARVLADAGVRIEAIEMEILGEYGFFRFLSADVDRAEQVLRENGYELVTTDMVEVHLSVAPAEFARMAETLGRAGVNIESCFGCATEDGDRARFFVRASDPDRAYRLLREAGFEAHRHAHDAGGRA